MSKIEQGTKVKLLTAGVLSPYGEPGFAPSGLAPRLDSLKGKRVVLWNDHIPPAPTVLEEVEKYLFDQGVENVIHAAQPGPAYPPQEENLAKAKGADAVILAAAA